jgi:hypothetical protein
MTRIHNLAALFVIIFSASFFISCQRELDSPGTGGGTGTTGEKVNASVRGTVIDDNNQPVAGATVTSGTSTTTTNNYGVFEFKNISLLKSNGSVKVEKAGFFKAIKSFVTTAGRTHHVRIHLITKNISGSFIASTGGTVTLSSGAKLVIPATAITDASGNPYTGNVNIAMTWIDPSSANLPELVPGDLRGINTTGQEMGLQTFGMIGVEMTGSGLSLYRRLCCQRLLQPLIYGISMKRQHNGNRKAVPLKLEIIMWQQSVIFLSGIVTRLFL